MVREIWRSPNFIKDTNKIKDNSIKEKIKKQLIKIINNPAIGKLLKYKLKGERTIYVKPYRIIYAFDKKTIYFLRFEHRKKIYKN